MIPPLSQLIKSETWETSLVLSSSHNLNPGSLFSISPVSCKSTGAGPLSVGIFVKHKFACVTLLLKRLQHLPSPCRIKSSMAHKAHMTCPLSSSQTKTVFGGEWDVTPRKLLCPSPHSAYPTCNSLIPPVVLKCKERIHLIHHVSLVPATVAEAERCNKHWLNELPTKIIPKRKARLIIINSFDQTKQAGSHIPSSLSILIYSLFKKESSLHYIKLNHNF